MTETPIHQLVSDSRNISIQEGRNRERQDIIDWLSKQKNKTIKIEDLIKTLKEK